LQNKKIEKRKKFEIDFLEPFFMGGGDFIVTLSGIPFELFGKNAL